MMRSVRDSPLLPPLPSRPAPGWYVPPPAAAAVEASVPPALERSGKGGREGARGRAGVGEVWPERAVRVRGRWHVQTVEQAGESTGAAQWQQKAAARTRCPLPSPDKQRPHLPRHSSTHPPTLLMHQGPQGGPHRHAEVWAARHQRRLPRRHILPQRNGPLCVQARRAEQQHAARRLAQLPAGDQGRGHAQHGLHKSRLQA